MTRFLVVGQTHLQTETGQIETQTFGAPSWNVFWDQSQQSSSTFDSDTELDQSNLCFCQKSKLCYAKLIFY